MDAVCKSCFAAALISRPEIVKSYERAILEYTVSVTWQTKEQCHGNIFIHLKQTLTRTRYHYFIINKYRTISVRQKLWFKRVMSCCRRDTACFLVISKNEQNRYMFMAKSRQSVNNKHRHCWRFHIWRRDWYNSNFYAETSVLTFANSWTRLLEVKSRSLVKW